MTDLADQRGTDHRTKNEADKIGRCNQTNGKIRIAFCRGPQTNNGIQQGMAETHDPETDQQRRNGLQTVEDMVMGAKLQT
jgi:hypothetical protein